MATLVRTKSKTKVEDVSQNGIEDGVPEPFPLAVMRLQLSSRGENNIDQGATGGSAEMIAKMPERREETDPDVESKEQIRPLNLEVQDIGQSTQTEMHPSMLRVQQTCLSTLNNLLMPRDHLYPWRPVIPSRRYSMPQRAQETAESSNYSLVTVLDNLRSLDTGEMIQIGSCDDTASLYDELREHVQRLSPAMSERDAELAFSLVTLVSRLDRLSMLSPDLRDNLQQVTPIDAHSPADMYTTLSRQVSNFQLSQMGAQASPGVETTSRQPIQEVEAALLWHYIDADFENVLRLCHHPQSQTLELRVSGDLESLPPGYEEGKHDDLPGYEYSEDVKAPGEDGHASMLSLDTTNEKMKLELDSVVMAIERMYIVAPQLHNQRAELRLRKSQELARANQSRSESGPSTLAPRTRKDSAIVELILKSANRRIVDQTYVLQEGNMKDRLAQVAQRDRLQREVFVEHIIERTSSGRLSSQDATPPIIIDRPRDPEEMISLPEFIREPIPQTHNVSSRPRSSEGGQPAGLSGTSLSHKSSAKNLMAVAKATTTKSEGSRQRSQSLSSLAKLFPGRSSPSPKAAGKMQAVDGDGESKDSKLLKLQYVAEYQEHLQTIVVLVHILGYLPPSSSPSPSEECKAEIIPWTIKTNPKLIIRYGPLLSHPLSLPAPVALGSYPVTTYPGNPSFDIKLPVDRTKAGKLGLGECKPPPTLLGAEQLSTMDPTSFVCTSCSLPIIRCKSSPSTTPLRADSTPPSYSPPCSTSNPNPFQDPVIPTSTPNPKSQTTYLDLPSEHWSELIDAWMCHPSQEFKDAVTKHAEGIWPKPGQVFLGVSYALVNEKDVVRGNLTLEREGEEWAFTRCLCGAVIGKCKEVQLDSGLENRVVSSKCYRFAKYSVRPVSPSSERVRLSLQAFFVEDMHCIAQIHANWRFVIYDDEEDRPRFLIWLFKPSIMMSWSTSTYRAISGEGNQLCAKVLFKILDKSITKDTVDLTLDKYPNFSRAESLFYPQNACRRLMALLKDSNRVFPEDMRRMAGLDIGFLERAA